MKKRKKARKAQSIQYQIEEHVDINTIKENIDRKPNQGGLSLEKWEEINEKIFTILTKITMKAEMQTIGVYTELIESNDELNLIISNLKRLLEKLQTYNTNYSELIKKISDYKEKADSHTAVQLDQVQTELSNAQEKWEDAEEELQATGKSAKLNTTLINYCMLYSKYVNEASSEEKNKLKNQLDEKQVSPEEKQFCVDFVKNSQAGVQRQINDAKEMVKSSTK